MVSEEMLVWTRYIVPEGAAEVHVLQFPPFKTALCSLSNVCYNLIYGSASLEH